MGIFHIVLICAALIGFSLAVVMEWRHLRKEERDFVEAMRRLRADAANLA